MSEGARKWLIPDAYIPERSNGELSSHEAICVLNTGRTDARLSISFYFEDRDPIKDVGVLVAAERTLHIRTDLPKQLGGTEIPKGVAYAIRVSSDAPVSVQHSRLDTSQEALALMTTIAYPTET
jgi:hypothetical protein